jgi:hypothetical protein
VNADPVFSQRMVVGSTARERPYRLLAGVAISLAVHAVLLFAYRQTLQPAKTDQAPAARSIVVWLRPPPPPPPPVAVPEPPPPAQPLARAPRPAKARPRPAPATDLIAVPDPSPGTAEAPDVFTVEPAAPRFDRDAALKAAREMANEPDPAKAGTAVAQIPSKPYATETKMARAIASAKRRDCKDGVPGGLLAPIFLMMDKKDSGCKW